MYVYFKIKLKYYYLNENKFVIGYRVLEPMK